MVRIDPIIAIRPDVKTLEILLAKLAGDQLPFQIPHTNLSQAPNPLQVASQPAFYLYEFKKGNDLKLALWTLTDLSSTPESAIKGHEQTLCNKVASIKNERKDRLWEKSPVVMVHQPIAALEYLFESIKQKNEPLEHPWESLGHKIWKISDGGHIEEIRCCIQKLDEVYVADGHHRLAAAYQDKTEEKRGISTLLVPWDAITINPFHRLINLEQHLPGIDLLQELTPYFFVSEIPNNVPYRPDRKNRIGLYYKSAWYQLDLKKDDNLLVAETDAVLLQNKILAPVLGITDPQTDQRLLNIPDKDWAKMIAEIYENADLIAFTLYQMDIADFISHAKNALFLPPKTTYIEPKIPPGMMMNTLVATSANAKASIFLK